MLFDSRIALLDNEILIGLRQRRRSASDIQMFRNEKRQLVNLRNVWKCVITAVDAIVNSFQQALQVTATNVQYLILEDCCPGFDPPTFVEIEKLKKKHPFNYNYVLMRQERNKYLMMGIKGRFALAAVYSPFDVYAFRNQYAKVRADNEGMFMSPLMTMRRLSYEYRMGVHSLSSGVMLKRFDVSNVREKQGLMDNAIPHDKDLVVSIDEDIANTVISHPLEGIAMSWKLTLGSHPSSPIDMFINADNRETCIENTGYVVRSNYVAKLNSTALVAVHAFQQQQDDPTLWTQELFAKIMIGTLYNEDPIHLASTLIMLNDVGWTRGWGYDWLVHMEWLSDKYPFRQEIENIRLLQEVDKRSKNCAAFSIQRWYRSSRDCYIAKVVKVQSWIRGDILVRRHRRAFSASLVLVNWYRKYRSRQRLINEIQHRVNVIYALSYQLEHYMSHACLQEHPVISKSIRRNSEYIPYVPFRVLMGLPAIIQFLVEVDKFHALRYLYRAARKIEWLLVLENGLAHVSWPGELQRQKEYSRQYHQMYMNHQREMELRYHQQFMQKNFGSLVYNVPSTRSHVVAHPSHYKNEYYPTYYDRQQQHYQKQEIPQPQTHLYHFQ